MGRIPRIIDPQGVYHVINRGNGRKTLFHDGQDYEAYLTLLFEARMLFGFSLFHFVLMPNHVHLLLRPNGENLSEAMHGIHRRYSRFHNRRHATIGHAWQGRFKSLHVDTDEYLFSCGNYIELNPVRAHLVKSPEHWEYSSYRFYAFGERRFPIDESPAYAALGATSRERELIYKRTISLTRTF